MDIDSLISHSESFHQLKMKMQLSGYVGDCVGCLVERFLMGPKYGYGFDSDRVSEDDFRNEEIFKKCYDFLQSINDRSSIEKFFTNKVMYSNIILCIFKPDGVNSMTVNLEDPRIIYQITKFIKFSVLIHEKDSEFIKNLHDERGNNILLIFSEFFRFKSFIDFKCRLGRNLTEDNITDVSSYITPFMKTIIAFFIKKFDCDPFLKNIYNICFSDFIKDYSTRLELGIEKNDTDLSGATEDKTEDQNNELSGNTANLLT